MSVKPRFAFIAASLAALAAMAPQFTLATPVTYVFSASETFTSDHSPLVDLIGAKITVNGQFTYDDAGTYTGLSTDLGYPFKMAMYEGEVPAVSQFSGVVTGAQGIWAFSDARGGADIGDNLGAAGNPSQVIQMRTEAMVNGETEQVPAGQWHDLQGFTVGGYQLANVRLFWLSGSGEYPDLGNLVDSSALPQQLPTHLSPMLALDFARVSDPSNVAHEPFFNNSIFFAAANVQAVPESGTLPLMLLGAASMAVALRRHRRG